MTVSKRARLIAPFAILAVLAGLVAASQELAIDYRATTAEALLTRIVSLDPNNLAATQALALRLFLRGALPAAERHARQGGALLHERQARLGQHLGRVSVPAVGTTCSAARGCASTQGVAATHAHAHTHTRMGRFTHVRCR